jgi:L-serine dehydratase
LFSTKKSSTFVRVIRLIHSDMESLKKLYKIGNGPSSSHTMGPKKAAEQFGNKNADADSFRATLYGSLAATGKGHLTDAAIINAFAPKQTEIVWKPEIFLPFHPNGMLFEAVCNGKITDSRTIYSIGGGDLADENTTIVEESVYELNTMTEILDWCQKTGKTFWEYVEDCEDKEIWDFLTEIWFSMKETIERGIEEEGVLPGGLFLQRKASSYFTKARSYTDSLRSRAFIYAYALATSEENANGGVIVTAPTCGSSGVLPAVLYHLHKKHEFSTAKIIRALGTAGLIGNIVKTNASVSGALVGCQGEIGVACSMAAAAATQLFGGTTAQVEYAAEMGLEHHLGLTCDPVCGLVQVPCIERNAFAAVRALDACSYAMLSDGQHLVSFDKVVQTMKQTGHDLPSLYKETSLGGLARFM